MLHKSSPIVVSPTVKSLYCTVLLCFTKFLLPTSPTSSHLYCQVSNDNLLEPFLAPLLFAFTFEDSIATCSNDFSFSLRHYTAFRSLLLPRSSESGQPGTSANWLRSRRVSLQRSPPTLPRTCCSCPASLAKI